MMRKAIGLDLSRSPAIGILADIEGNILDHNSVDLAIDAPFNVVAEDIKKLVSRLRHPDLTGIGVGTPGWLDSYRGICHFSPNYPTWNVEIRTAGIRITRIRTAGMRISGR